MTTALAIDLGGTKVEAALVDEDGTVVTASRHRAPTGREASSEQLAGAVEQVVRATLADLPSGAELAGVGIGAAGLLAGLAPLPFLLCLAAGAAQLAWQVAALVPDRPADCLVKFNSNRWFGLLILAGLAAGRALA